MQEGVIQFEYQLLPRECYMATTEWAAVEAVKYWCVERGWFGVGADGIGYGNISVRDATNGMWVSGSQTANNCSLGDAGMTWVNINQKLGGVLVAKGEYAPSSESWLHLLLYQSYADIKSVLHIHDWEKWDANAKGDTIEEQSGTVAFAEMLLEQIHSNSGVLRMAKHRGGYLAWGNDIKECYQILVAELG